MNSLRDVKKLDHQFTHLYRGLVEENADPKQGLRIQVRVYPMMQGFKTQDLPWAQPCFPVIAGSKSGAGWQAVPAKNSYVWVMFEEGDIRRPVYIGEAFRPIDIHPEMVDVDTKVIKVPSGSYISFDKDGNIILNPNATHRSVVNALAQTIKTYSVDHNLDGDDGGLVLLEGTVTINLPDAADYPGIIYVFKKIDTVGIATIVGDIEDRTFWRLTSQWDGIILASHGSKWIVWKTEGLPVGVMNIWPTDIAPSGYLLCDGTIYPVADYPALAAVLGSQFGGDGVATFATPDMRGRVPLGKDNMGGSPANRVTLAFASTIGLGGGSEKISVAELPPHHHQYVYAGGAPAYCVQYAASGGAANADTANTGDGDPHVQPSLTVNYIIKY